MFVCVKPLRHISLLVAMFLTASACQNTALPTTVAPPPPGARYLADTGQVCGGMRGVSCAHPQDFCMTAPQAQCGAADQTGICTPRPEICTMDYSPVCGCDGITYSNACAAAAAGMSIIAQGECRN